eukprot:scaffold447_cov307-Pinguiococcus_pyrenoidosus.AAC.15
MTKEEKQTASGIVLSPEVRRCFCACFWVAKLVLRFAAYDHRRPLLAIRKPDDWPRRQASKSRVCEGIILQCGPGRMSSEGETIPMPVKPDDKIKFREYGGEEVNIEGTEYMVVRANDILAKW